MIARYEFQDLSKEKSNKLLLEQGHPSAEKAMSLAEIFRLKDKAFGKPEVKKIGF